jgi:tetratricopeptide (TPR) repeat protein/tRNA A-37 threonylcarbamoyl transferase component Bud32
MADMKTCPDCGTPLPHDAPEGNCPSCLLSIGLASGSTSPFPASDEATVRRFGDYELLQKIGAGGMANVYRARQISLKREVALKLIRAGQLASDQELRRFEMEAEAAASLDHPNIVPVYEVGVHEGWHYLGMRLVDGQSLDRLMPRYRADPRAMASLLAKVARAIHYAHQRGILHRDLKPSNVIIDPAGEPHVTDFGLAKRVDQDMGVTLSGQLVGTPAYMAPEQMRTSAKRLTTAADIYSLGVILYELLTGEVPFRGETALETLRQAVEREPKRPSTIQRQVDRDLETICLRCLEKEPERRYSSAEALAEELERWLRHEPIHARPSNVWMRGAKWARRRPAAAAAIALLLIGTCISTWQAVRATRAEREQRRLREEAEQARADAKLDATKGIQMAEFLLGLLKGVRPAVARGTDTTILREMMDQGLKDFTTKLKDVPEVQAHLLHVIARTFEDLGDHEKAASLNRESLRLFRIAYEPEHPKIAESLNNLGAVLVRQGDFKSAEAAHREALALRKKLFGDTHKDTAMSLDNLAAVLVHTDLVAAEALSREALAIYRKVRGDLHEDVAMALANVASIEEKRGELERSEADNREALAMFEKLHGHIHPDVAISLDNLGVVLRRQGKLDEAEALHRDALAVNRKLYGETHIEVADSLHNLAEVLRARGRLEEAETLYRDALAMRKAGLGEAHPKVASSYYALGQILKQRGDLAAAESLHREALEIRRKVYGNNHTLVADSLAELAAVIQKQSRQPEADKLLAEADEIQQRLKDR